MSFMLRLMYNALRLSCINHIPSILVLQCNVEAVDGTVHVEDSLLAVAPLQCIDDYKLEEEDPGVFSDGDDPVGKWTPRKEWPDKPLPVRQAAHEPQAEQANQAFIDHLMQQHHMQGFWSQWGLIPVGSTKEPRLQVYWLESERGMLLVHCERPNCPPPSP